MIQPLRKLIDKASHVDYASSYLKADGIEVQERHGGHTQWKEVEHTCALDESENNQLHRNPVYMFRSSNRSSTAPGQSASRCDANQQTVEVRTRDWGIQIRLSECFSSG